MIEEYIEYLQEDKSLLNEVNVLMIRKALKSIWGYKTKLTKIAEEIKKTEDFLVQTRYHIQKHNELLKGRMLPSKKKKLEKTLRAARRTKQKLYVKRVGLEKDMKDLKEVIKKKKILVAKVVSAGAVGGAVGTGAFIAPELAKGFKKDKEDKE